jgi:hypothetical protein
MRSVTAREAWVGRRRVVRDGCPRPYTADDTAAFVPRAVITCQTS